MALLRRADLARASFRDHAPGALLDRRALWSLPLVFALVAGGAWALSRVRSEPRSARAPAPRPTPRSPAVAGPAAPPGGPFRWIVAGGGSLPELNQVQLEQDVELAAEVLSARGPGLLLFAGGAGSRAVQVVDAPADGEARAGEATPASQATDLRARLAALFGPGLDRAARYRRTELAVDGAASAEGITSALEGALGDGDAPLTVYLAGHGVGGEAPHESRFLTWGAHDLWVEDLAAVLDDTPGHRPVRLVVTACYAGGFAELAFDAADPARGAARTDRCGLFATTWDRAAAGCDPNPDRGAQEGYGIHFLHALAGRGRDGELPAERLDLDGDGAISLLEAHSRARIASRSLDVPVTTSERFLRAAVEPSMVTGRQADASAARFLPEERAVVAALTERLELARPDEVHARLEAHRLALDERAAELDGLDAELDAVEGELRASLLHRWPVLNDPWSPRFEATLAASGEAIATFLDASALTARRAELQRERARVADRHDARLVAMAPLERLARALETLRLAAALRAEGGRYWLRYQALLACERGLP